MPSALQLCLILWMRLKAAMRIIFQNCTFTGADSTVLAKLDQILSNQEAMMAKIVLTEEQVAQINTAVAELTAASSAAFERVNVDIAALRAQIDAGTPATVEQLDAILNPIATAKAALNSFDPIPEVPGVLDPPNPPVDEVTGRRRF